MKYKILKYNHILILLCVTLLVGFPLLRSELLNGHDAVFHFFRTSSIKIAINDGQLIPLLNPNMLGSFGYATNMFYGVLTSYIVTFLSIFIKPIGLCINLLILITIFLSGFFMYKFINELTSNKKVSIIGGILYMTSPYLLFDIYVRMSLGEIACFIFMPLLFRGLYNIIEKNKEKWYLLTLGATGLILSHNISTFMAIIFSFIYLLFNLKKVLKKECMKKLILGLFIALLLSLPTILPLIEAKMSSNYMVFDTSYMKTTGDKMISKSIDLFKSSLITKVTRYYFIIYIMCLLCMIFKNNLYKLTKQVLIITGISLLLSLSFIPWNHLPTILSSIQFPWRFLQISSFFLALLIALLLAKEKGYKKLKYLIIIPILIITCIPLINLGIKNKGVNNDLINHNRLKKRGEIVRSTGTASAEYLPRNAIYKYDYLKKHSMKPTLLEGDIDIKGIKKNGTHLSFDVNSKVDSTIELPYIYYPGYIAKVGKKKVATFEDDNGLLALRIPKGNYKIKVHYRGTMIMIFSYVTFVITMVVFLYLIKRIK